MLFCVVMAIQIMLVAFLYSQKVFFECIVSYFIVFSVSNPNQLIKNYISALIAVGRDISRGRTYRNSRILSSDLTPGNRLITWDSEENKIEWVTTPGQAKSREYVIQQNFDLIIPGHGPPFTSKVWIIGIWLALFYLMIRLHLERKIFRTILF